MEDDLILKFCLSDLVTPHCAIELSKNELRSMKSKPIYVSVLQYNNRVMSYSKVCCISKNMTNRVKAMKFNNENIDV